MSISSEIQRLQNAKADLKTAIEGKGVTVSSSAKLDDYADLVDAIQTGGGSEWQRPSDWPNLSVLDRTGTVVYVTCQADSPSSYISINTKMNSGKPKIAFGNIVNGEYVVESEAEGSQNGYARFLIGEDPSGYKVVRITENNNTFTGFGLGDATETQLLINGVAVTGVWSSVLEIYGNLPRDLDFFGFRTCKRLRSLDVTNARPRTNNGLNYSFAYNDYIENLDVSTWDVSNATRMDSTFRAFVNPKGVENFNTENVTNTSRAFNGVTAEELDLSGWDMSSVTDMTFMFATSTAKSIKVNGSSVSCSAANLFENCPWLTDVYVSDTSHFTSINRIFSGCKSIVELDLSDWDLSSVTSSDYAFNGMASLIKITLPSTLSLMGRDFLSGSHACMEMHFKATTPPTLSATNPFPTMNAGNGRKIYVPYSADHSILNAYQTATNWSTYASYIVEEAE